MPLALPIALPAAARLRRDVVEASGPDTLTFLQGQLSQDVAALAAGAAAWSFVLRPDGKVDAWVRVHRRADEEVALDVDAGWGAPLLARLERFKLRTRCDLRLTEDVPMLALRGATLAGGLPCGWPGVEGSDVLAAGPSSDDGLPAGTVEVDAAGYAALRIAGGVPAMGQEITEATIPAELGQWVVDASVSFTKGCFTGQELVARIDSRGGNVPRRLRGFTADGLAPAPGGDLVIDGAVVGRVTSVATAPDGSALGLALVKRSVVPPVTATIGGEDGSSSQVLLHEVP